MHLTNDVLRHLATLVLEDLPFDTDDASHMQHIGECEECYQKLQSYMALFETNETDNNTPLFARLQDEPVQSSETVIISVVLFDAKAMFTQINTENTSWVFDHALSGAWQRTTGDINQTEFRYEDIENSNTYISFNKKELIIQIDSRGMTTKPSAIIRFPSGSEYKIQMRQHEYLFVGSANDFPEKRFNVVINK